MKKVVLALLILFTFQNSYSQKKVSIVWDVSYSMQDRNINRDINFLNNYFKKFQDVDIHLTMFSNEIVFESDYEIRKSNWEKLKAVLMNSIYDGSTSFNDIIKPGYEEYLVFTDGIENVEKFQPLIDKPLKIVSTTENTNVNKLKLYADLSSGNFTFLTQDLNYNNNTEIVNKEDSEEKLDPEEISGTISGVNGVLANVNIINKNTGSGVVSDQEGKYVIKAKEGDIVEFSFIGKKKVRAIIGKTKVLDVSMPNSDENLDEVVLIQEIEATEDVIDTGYGQRKAEAVGYATQTITSEKIPDAATEVGNAVAGKFTGLNLALDSDLSLFKGRGSSLLLSEYGLIVVDGMPIDRSTIDRSANTNFIDPNNIESITHLKGLAATNIYGTQGNNGVLVIKTKTAAKGKATKEKKIKIGTTATYSGNAEAINELPDTPYIKALRASSTVSEAFDNYLIQRKTYGDDASFFIDVFDYFNASNYNSLSKRILSNVYEVAFNNVNDLRALAYKQQSVGFFTEAANTYDRIRELAPRQSQSYRDLALAYIYAKEFDKALKLYDAIDKNRGVNDINTTGIEKTITNDVKNLISRHGNNLDTRGINEKYLRAVKYKSRIIFEWNDLDAEFDLNIINPQKRYFTWSHTIAENSQRIMQQKENGYGLEEFYLTSSDVGEWTFNIKYYGKTTSSKSPTFIKITIYKDFGQPNQSKEIKVIRLEKQDVELAIAKVKI